MRLRRGRTIRESAWRSVAAALAPGAPAPVAAPAHSGAGPLGNLDEARLRTRLRALSLAVVETTREDFPGCRHTTLRLGPASGSAAWAGDLLLLACDSVAIAASEAQRLRRGFPAAWIVHDEDQVLFVGAPAPGAPLASERASRELTERLLAP